MQVTVTKWLLESGEWQTWKKEARDNADADMGLRDEGIYRTRTMERLRRALEVPGVESVVLTDEEAVQIGLLMRKEQR